MPDRVSPDRVLPLTAEPQPRFYYGWAMLWLAAAAMVGTLPARTYGQAFITEPLLKDFGIGREAYAQIMLWATLIGALFCVGVGKLLDRFGTRPVLTTIVIALGLTTIAMSRAKTETALLVQTTLTRGFGQSALSVVSLAMVGIWFRRRINMAMASYSVLLSIGFIIAFVLLESAVKANGWRAAWAGIGWILLLALAPASLLLARRGPSGREAAIEGDRTEEGGGEGCTLGQALSTPAFWVIGLASAVYGLVAAGIGIFNESVLAEHGLDRNAFVGMIGTTAMVSLIGNFVGGWLAAKWSMNRLMAVAMVIMGAGLLALTQVTALWHAYAVGALMGLAGGFVMVLFFAYWRAVYGKAHLGLIQGAAQTLTVLASAVGPLLLATWVERTGTYNSAFYALAIVVALMAVAAWVVKQPPATVHR